MLTARALHCLIARSLPSRRHGTAQQARRTTPGTREHALGRPSPPILPSWSGCLVRRLASPRKPPRKLPPSLDPQVLTPVFVNHHVRGSRCATNPASPTRPPLEQHPKPILSPVRIAREGFTTLCYHLPHLAQYIPRGYVHPYIHTYTTLPYPTYNQPQPALSPCYEEMDVHCIGMHVRGAQLSKGPQPLSACPACPAQLS